MSSIRLTGFFAARKTRVRRRQPWPGFDEAETDKVRKVVKKAGGVKPAQYEQQLFAGCQRNGAGGETRQSRHGA